MKNVLLLFLTTIFLTACGTTTKLSNDDLTRPIAKGNARVIIERDYSFLYSAGAARIAVNGQQIGSLGLGGEAVKDVQAGNVTLKVTTPTAPGQFVLRFTAKPRQTYRFEVSPRSGQLFSGAVLGIAGDSIHASVSDQSGYFQIEPTGSSQ